ncbi:MAG: hypothetical protein LBE86_06795 [Gemmobacter sp.]|jgi:hypothetical protein|nr:hypothetical protein [Gemmobacter sp.]
MKIIPKYHNLKDVFVLALGTVPGAGMAAHPENPGTGFLSRTGAGRYCCVAAIRTKGIRIPMVQHGYQPRYARLTPHPVI